MTKSFVLFQDMNECLGDNECHAFADCTNTDGSYTCTCKDGYQGNGKECAKGELEIKGRLFNGSKTVFEKA